MRVNSAARIFGLITFIFGMGQIAGPAVAEFLAEQTGNFANSFLMTAIMAILAALLSAQFRSTKAVTTTRANARHYPPE